MKFKLITTNCKRCSRQIATGNKSLYGANAAKAKYGSICERCVTPQERHEMNLTIGKAIASPSLNQQE